LKLIPGLSLVDVLALDFFPRQPTSPDNTCLAFNGDPRGLHRDKLHVVSLLKGVEFPGPVLTVNLTGSVEGLALAAAWLWLALVLFLILK
jgi:hypothetical protein